MSEAISRSSAGEPRRQGNSMVAHQGTETPYMSPVKRWGLSPFFVRAMGVTLALACCYVLYERIGTTANVDRLTTFESHDGNMIAIGVTEQEPGFLLLSYLPEDDIELDTSLYSNRLTGTRTIVHIQTPQKARRIRLRAPQVIMVRRDGSIAAESVPWTRDDFGALMHAVDCATECADHVHRCGQPLESIKSTLANWPSERVPPAVLEFMENENTGHPGGGAIDRASID